MSETLNDEKEDKSDSDVIYVGSSETEDRSIVTIDSATSDNSESCSSSHTLIQDQVEVVSTDSDCTHINVNDENSYNDNQECAASSVERHATQKRKRIHMNTVGCLDYTQSETGKQALVAPSMMQQNKDPNRGLHPVMRNKRRKVSSGGCISDKKPSANNSHGFVKASHLYDLSFSQSSEKSDNTAAYSKSKRKPNEMGKKTQRNQGTLTGFFSVKTTSETSTNCTETASCSTVQSSLEASPSKSISSIDSSPSRSLMYSPIKKLNDTAAIYIGSDDGRESCGSDISNVSQSQNAVIKQLFAAQKTADLKSKKTPSQIATQAKLKAARAKFTQSQPLPSRELTKIKDEAVKYFDNESVDLNDMFDSFDEDSGSELKKGSVISSSCSSTTKDRYGLLGSGKYPRSESPKINFFETLPAEVLEIIFCQLPMLDLCLNSNRVCLAWNDIISAEKFVPWKKLYHELKKNHGSSRQTVRELMKKHHMTAPSNYLISLIRYMKDFKKVTPGNMTECLTSHKKYHWASALISERLPDCVAYQNPNPWCVIATLVILSHNVYEIQEIIRCLSVSSSQCTSIDILESLYCVATFLFSFKLVRSQDVWNGMHYRLFYALYLYENASSTSCADLAPVTSSSTGQQSLVKYSSGSDGVRLTHEQLRIVKHQPRSDEVIKIVAFAGTGKTTTLVRYTQLRPDKSFLLVVYNKSVCDYAKTKFPRNVECRTGHSLAFKDYGRRYAHKLFGIKVYKLTQTLPSRKGDNLFVRAKNVMSTLEGFFASADQQIIPDHVPEYKINDRSGFKEPIDLATKHLYVKDAEYIWNRMKDPRDKELGMSHDGYLKLFQLSSPSLSKYGCILIDEAQDLTPAITDVLLRQPQGKILVGDPHQQIYSFRGAVNAMTSIQADTIFYLTQSFRFGPEIAHVAATCLEVLKKEKSKTLVGSGKKCTVLGQPVGQIAIISRNNFTVFSEAVKRCCYNKDPCKVAFVGGTKNFGFDMLMDMHGLLLSPEERQKENIYISHNLIKMFKTFGDMENFATKSMDNELLGKIRIVKTYGHTLPMHIRTITSKCVSDERRADYVFSTAHKSKGLEFSTVRLTDDFLSESQPTMNIDIDGEVIISPPRPFGDEATDEENLLYVAVTRAKNSLQMSQTLLRVLKQGGEFFRYPVLSSDSAIAGSQFKCVETDAVFEPTCLTLKRLSLKLGDGTQLSEQLYSPAFLAEDFASFSSLLGPLPSTSTATKKASSS